VKPKSEFLFLLSRLLALHGAARARFPMAGSLHRMAVTYSQQARERRQ